MTTKADKAAIQLMVAKHLRFYGAPVGKRKCKYELSDDCLKTDSEKHFDGHMCTVCVKVRQNEFYQERMRVRGENGNPLRARVGRPCKIVVVVKSKKRKCSTKKSKKKKVCDK